MPELPEVETIKNDLKKRILGKKIVGIEIRGKKMVHPVRNSEFSNGVKNKPADFIKILKANSFSGLDRIGKLLIFELADRKSFLLIHLKMTGQLIYCGKGEIVAGGHAPTPSNSPLIRGRINPLLLPLAKGENGGGIILLFTRGGAPAVAGAEGWVGGGREGRVGVGEALPNKHTRIIFSFANGAKLFFNDLRKFGYAKIVGGKELEKIKGEYGPEPLTKGFTLVAFRKVLEGKNAPIKAILLNQGLIAGIGNIYADEALFEARIRPSRRARSLSDRETGALFKAINNVIKKAIKYRGTTFDSYVDATGRRGNFTRLLKVYHREGEKCKRCGAVIKKTRVAGRGTRYCDKCQK